MDTTDYVLIFILCALVLAMIGVASYIEKSIKAHKKKVRETVAFTSPILKSMASTIKELGIVYDIPQTYTRHFYVNSKQAFDNFNFEKHILEDIEENYDEYKWLHDKLDNNYGYWLDFLDKFETTEHQPVDPQLLKSLRIKEDKYIEIESELVEKMKKHEPPDHCDIDYEVTYQTPKGSRTYTDTYGIVSESLTSYLAKIDELNQFKESAQYQRRLITPKKRAEIIAKDHGRCCLCGRSVKDGAQLEVDHFIPVSKGGKSTDDNLWTLCRDCNRGKSNFTIEELQDIFDQALAER